MERLLLSLLFAALLALCVYGMWRGWRRQARTQSVRIPPFPERPESPGAAELEESGLYVATTYAGHWQERIVTRGAGLRGPATLRLHADGIDVDRAGMPGFWIPRSAITGVATGRGMAGKVMGSNSLLVVTWVVGDGDDAVEVDTGFRADDRGVYPQWIERLDGTQVEAGQGNGGAQV
ncbi:transporter [Saccharomonospora sp. CUA-673]|uniref:PH-like domain-containing protein n=1 Tax=Saccharomonospora sp. CUA-673 TaxID=1904969 RepID=UPI000962F09F|nr:transporter [Saccharomonospora sp. CUA-673]OLT43628.1 transporter [Saccharomonospora sp. CUA-673]